MNVWRILAPLLLLALLATSDAGAVGPPRSSTSVTIDEVIGDACLFAVDDSLEGDGCWSAPGDLPIYNDCGVDSLVDASWLSDDVRIPGGEVAYLRPPVGPAEEAVSGRVEWTASGVVDGEGSAAEGQTFAGEFGVTWVCTEIEQEPCDIDADAGEIDDVGSWPDAAESDTGPSGDVDEDDADVAPAEDTSTAQPDAAVNVDAAADRDSGGDVTDSVQEPVEEQTRDGEPSAGCTAGPPRTGPLSLLAGGVLLAASRRRRASGRSRGA